MTDIDVSYYNGSSWTPLTDYATRFQINELGIQKVSNAAVNFKVTERSNFQSFLSNPYRLMRIRANISGWQTLFYGYCNKPYVKTITGTIGEKVKMSLDLNSFSARLAADTITFDYYKLQSSITPYSAASWTFRNMLQDILDYPDSRDDAFPYSTGFVLAAATDTTGIDAILDGIGNWENQTLFEAVRLTAEHLGLDGYYYLLNETSDPTIRLYPYSKASTYTLTAPFIEEPTWEGGSLDDIGNKVYLEGGVDAGLPSDGDRWTEWGVTKYSPAIWSASRTGATTTVTDEDSVDAVLSFPYGTKCIKVSTTGSTNQTLDLTLAINNTEAGQIDGLERISQVFFNYKTFGNAYVGTRDSHLDIILTDGDGHQVIYRIYFPEYMAKEFEQSIEASFPDANENLTSTIATKKWSYYNGSSSFTWANITQLTIRMEFPSSTYIYSGQTWGFWIDGLQFVGGKKIGFFEPLNPPFTDTSSLDTHGIHVYKHTDSTIFSFEQAAAEKARLLANLSNPIDMLKLKKYAPTTQLYPSNVVTVSSVDYRIASIVYEWTTSNKQVKAGYNLVQKTSPLPPIWTEQNELRYLIK